MKFSIWYNNDIKWFIELIKNYKDYISSIYFSPPKHIANSLREEKQNSENHENNIIKLIWICKKYKIRSIMLFNATSEWSKTWSIKSMLSKISYMKKIQKLWLNAVSITNMLHVQFIKKAIPKIIIYSSVNCNVKEIEMAKHFKDLWVDILTIPEEKNRDFKFIKNLKEKLNFQVQVMLNEWCIRNCPFRDIHCTISSHWWEFDESWKKFNADWLIPSYHCVGMFKRNKKMIFRSCFIRPEDIWFYKNKVDYFKIVSRDFNTKKIEKVLNAYIKQKYNWNLFDIVDFPVDPKGWSISYIDNELLTKKDFFNKIQKCPSDCDNCNICEEFIWDKIYNRKLKLWKIIYT